MFNGFRGTAGGAVQTNYTDQPGVAYAGQIAFASDSALMDAVLVGEAEGLLCGAAVKLIANPAADVGNMQVPNVLAVLMDGDDVAADFAGFVVFEEGSQSDANGNPGWNKGRVARILRNVRGAGRIYIKFKDPAVAYTSTVNVVISAGSDGKYKVGDVAPAALAGTAEAGTSVAIATAKVVSSCAAGGVAIVELLG